ncbi:homoserine/homoserine lactone efflux protein, partial [Vibrio agarivorans]
GSLLLQSDQAFNFIKWVGILYLIYLGIKKIVEKPVFHEQSKMSNKVNSWSVLLQSTLINVTNPKSIVFLVALLPQFILPNYSYPIQMLIMGTTLVCVDCFIMFLYAILAQRLSLLIHEPKHIVRLNRVFGTMFIFASTLLAISSLG